MNKLVRPKLKFSSRLLTVDCCNNCFRLLQTGDVIVIRVSCEYGFQIYFLLEYVLLLGFLNSLHFSEFVINFTSVAFIETR